MLDEDDKPWLIEINAICNMVHSKNSKVDTVKKKKILFLFISRRFFFENCTFLTHFNFFFSNIVYFRFICIF